MHKTRTCACHGQALSDDPAQAEIVRRSLEAGKAEQSFDRDSLERLLDLAAAPKCDVCWAPLPADTECNTCEQHSHVGSADLRQEGRASRGSYAVMQRYASCTTGLGTR